jgi:metal-responsive CopG/Arc/MetJ family transcriptional regulator
LPDPLAKASQEAAKTLGISRTQFIRQAIAHELESFQAELEREAMVRSVLAMKNSKKYLKESDEIDEGLNSDLPKEEEWWNKDKS